MATGIGKTNIEHQVIEAWKREKPFAKVLYIAGTKLTLVDQLGQALSDYQLQSINFQDPNSSINFQTEDVEDILGEIQKDLPFYRLGLLKDTEADVQVATIQTVQAAYRLGVLNPDDYDLIIVDEVHNIGTPKRFPVIQQFKNVAGFTATAYRSSGDMKTPKDYGFKVVFSLSLPEAQGLRLLPPLLGIQINTVDLVPEIPMTPSGRINFTRLEKILKESPELRPFIVDRVADIICDGDKEYKTVMVVNFVWEAQELAQLLKGKGIKVGVAVNQQAAKAIHSDEIPALDAIDRYKLPHNDPNSLQVLISPYVVSEGFDAPATEVLVWASPTGSDLRYTQYTCRLARRAPGKAFGLVVDCLYQTSQFNWNFNFAMWMKENVKQLLNGFLYLGPAQGFGDLIEMDFVKAIRNKREGIVDIADLQRGPIEEVKETDFVVSEPALKATFIGKADKTKRLAQKVLSFNPELKAIRRANSFMVMVCTDKARFIELMIENGAVFTERQQTLDLTDSDLVLNESSLIEKFAGDPKIKVMPTAEEVINLLREENPSLFAQRRTLIANRIVPVYTDAHRFVDEMEKRGVSVKGEKVLSDEEISQGTIPITGNKMRELFFGESTKLMKLADRLRANNPQFFERRRNGLIHIWVCTDKNFLMTELQKLGLKVRTEMSEPKESDFIITRLELNKIFIGGIQEKIKSMAEDVVRRIKAEDLSKIVERRRVAQIFEACTDRELFIKYMVEAGAILRQDEKESK